eukprot:tig00021758_g23399.t1
MRRRRLDGRGGARRDARPAGGPVADLSPASSFPPSFLPPVLVPLPDLLPSLSPLTGQRQGAAPRTTPRAPSPPPASPRRPRCPPAEEAGGGASRLTAESPARSSAGAAAAAAATSAGGSGAARSEGIEVHANTRGEMRPDPRADAVAAIVYAVLKEELQDRAGHGPGQDRPRLGILLVEPCAPPPEPPPPPTQPSAPLDASAPAPAAPLDPHAPAPAAPARPASPDGPGARAAWSEPSPTPAPSPTSPPSSGGLSTGLHVSGRHVLNTRLPHHPFSVLTRWRRGAPGAPPGPAAGRPAPLARTFSIDFLAALACGSQVPRGPQGELGS